MSVIEKQLNGKVELLEVLPSENKGCEKCIFKNECTNPPVNRLMPCFSSDRLDKVSVYYQIAK